MELFTLILIFLIILWASIYTVSYAIWTWKEKNRLGAVMLFIVATVTIVLPVFTIFIRGQ